MKKLFLTLLLLAAGLCHATTTVTGTLQNLGTGTVTNSYVRFWLRGCKGGQPRISGTGIIAPSQGGVFYFDLPANSSGVVSGTIYSTRDAAGTGDGEIECNNSKTAEWYGLQAFYKGQGGPEVAVHAQIGVTMDISSVIPIVTPPMTSAGNTPLGNGAHFVTSNLTTTTPGHCAIWLANNVLGDTPCTGTGDLLSTPGFSQTVNQPTVAGTRTSFNPNVMHDVVYLNTADTTLNWSKSPVSPATLSAGSTVISITGCPKGLSTKNHYVYIAGTGAPEIAPLTAFSCAPDAASGTITVTVANSHSAGYTVGTASSGLKEASEYEITLRTLPNGYSTGGIVRVASGAQLTLRGTTYIEGLYQTIDFQNAEVDITGDYATYPCTLQIGDTTAAGGTLFGNITLLNATGFKPTVAGAGGICLNSQSTHITDLSSMIPDIGNYWEHFLIIKNDQSAVVDKIDMFAMGGGNKNYGNCTVSKCSSMIYGPGGSNFGILKVGRLQMTLGNQANGVDWLNNNTLQIDNCILQNIAQFAIRTSTTFADNPNLNVGFCYMEGVGAANPTGLGGAGIIGLAGSITIDAGIIAGLQPKYANTGATSYLYYIVPIDSSSRKGVPQLSGWATLTTTGTLSVKWYNIAPTGSYDILRVQTTSPVLVSITTASATGGTVAALGSVGLAQSAASVCDVNNICTFTDDISLSTSAYTVVSPTYYPKLNFWPAAFVSSPPSESTSSTTGTGKFYMNQFSVAAFPSGGFVSPFGSQQVVFSATRCQGGGGSATLGVSCMTYPPTAMGATWMQAISNGAGSKQGRLTFAMPYGFSLATTDIITIKPKTPANTFASLQTLYRPTWEDTDDAIGYETASSGGTYIRGGNSLRQYIGKLPDNAPQWQLLATGAVTPLVITSTLATGSAPFSIASTTKVANLNADKVDGLSLFKFTQSLSPASVAANTCAEQTFTVTGVATGDAVYVNKPASQAGLGVAGVRASATNQIAINFCNATASPIVPTASETYTVGAIR